MAEDDGKGSGRSRFKSKWGKILKHSDDIKSLSDTITAKKGKQSNAQEDVDDFLKPSTERAAANRPRLDVSLAQRWPQPSDGRQADALPPDGSQSVNGWRKRRRREGLTVGFVKTVPETIGHGGDETLDPPSDVALLKARNARAALDNPPAGQPGGAHMPVPNHVDGPRPPPPAGAPDMSFGGAQAPNQPRNGRPSTDEPLPPPRIGISRAPTGFSPKPDDWSPASDNDDAPSLPTIQPPAQNGPDYLKVSPTPRDPNNLTTRRRRDMTKNEGMALRRASAMIEPIDVEDGSDLDLGQYAAATATFRAEAAATPPVQDPNRPPTLPNVDLPSPQSDTSLDSPSPFSDEKYIKRHSREAPIASTHAQSTQAPVMAPAPPPQGGRSPFADPKYLQSRSKESSPARSQRREPVDQSSPARIGDQPALELSRQYLDPQTDIHPAALAAPENAPRIERPQNADMSYVVPQGPRQPPPSHRTPSPLATSQASAQLPLQVLEQPLHMEPAKPMGHENTIPASARPMPAPRLRSDFEGKSNTRDQSPLRNRIFDSSTASQKPPTLSSRPNGSSTSVNRFAPPSGSHSRNNSYDQKFSSSMERTTDCMAPQSSLHTTTSRTSPPSSVDAMVASQTASHLAPSQQRIRAGSSASSQLAPPEPSPYARRPSANDYLSSAPQGPMQPAKSPVGSLQPGDAQRPGSAHSSHSFLRQAPPSHSPSATDLAAQASFDDFTSRVAHMKGVFKLTAEKEQPAVNCTPFMWLRAAYWWYLRGKIGLEGLLQQRAKSPETEHRELLLQPHVDLAKTSWMLSDPLEHYDESGSQGSLQRSDSDMLLRRDLQVLKDHLKSLSHSMRRNNVMPPPQSLIQGQDTQIWLEYPKFAPDATAALGGAGNQGSFGLNNPTHSVSPSDALPLGDTNDYHYYTRSTVNVSLNTDDVNTDRVSIPCNLTVLRGKRDYQSTVVIASQSELVNIRIAPRQSNASSVSWQDISWKASSLAISISLPRGIDLTVRFFEHDFRSLWNLVEYSRRVDHSLRSEKNEMLLHEGHLVEVQYADSSNTNAFPQDKVKRCRALLWEKNDEYRDGGAVHKRHRGFRIAVTTDAGQKSLSSFSHDIGSSVPLAFEFITDAAAQGTTAMVIRIGEHNRQCRMLLVFQDMEGRQALYSKLNGIDVRPNETIVGKMALTDLKIEPMADAVSGSSSGQSKLAGLQWQRLGVTNHFVEDPNNGRPTTVESQSLRVIARHNFGCITDRMNLNRGELLLRLPCVDSPTIQILRQPQADMTMSIDVRNTPPNVADSVADVYKMVQNLPTVRTMTFATPGDLHAFETAITGFTVRFDGLASTLGISRRRMVVPIYHKWTATNVRIQVVSNAQNSVFQVVAFMEGFAQAEALCFQIKSTDVFETVKGDGKNKKWAVKMVDAKFTLPPTASSKDSSSDLSPDDKAKRRFVNLEGLDYAQEHDDITVGFDSEEARDTFAKCLPAAATAGRMITLKRRI